MVGMPYIQGIARGQAMLLPAAVDDYVGPENPVRFLDYFVEGLNVIALGFAPMIDRGQGAPGYDPKALLKLFLYGYLNRLRSSRELEKATKRNLEVIWLLRTLTPDHWTINEFRRQHRHCFQAVFREFNLLCAKLKLFGQELVAIDGSYCKAVNHPSRNFTKAKLEAALVEIDARTERYLQTLEQTDRQAAQEGMGKAGASSQAQAEALQQKLAIMEERRAECAALLAEVSATPGKQISLTDPDSRSLQKGSDKVVGYNVQIAVDTAHHLIVTEAVTTQPNDSQLLAPMAMAARAALGVEKLAATTDTGYYNIEQLVQCEQQGIETYVPAPHTKRQAGNGSYPDSAFRYEAEPDHYLCPQGHQLTRHGQNQKSSGRYHLYYNRGACRECPVRAQCTRGAYRQIAVHEHRASVVAAQSRLQARPEIMGQRLSTVEHVFGTIKFWDGSRAFLTRGLEMVSAEFTLSCLSYNMRRVLNLVSVPELLAKLNALAGGHLLAMA